MARAFPNSPHAIRKAKDDCFRLIIANAGREKKIRQKDVAEAIHVTPQTMSNRMQTPENLTLGELRALKVLLNLSPEDLDSII